MPLDVMPLPTGIPLVLNELHHVKVHSLGNYSSDRCCLKKCLVGVSCTISCRDSHITFSVGVFGRSSLE